MSASVLEEITASGVSLWLDDLNRNRLDGSLADLITNRAIRGVTTNPTIFDRAISAGGDAYREQLDSLRGQGTDVDSAIRQITTDDVRAACDILRPVWQASGGLDGRVSIEVDPRLAHDAQGTVTQARELWSIVDRPNAMIKIPATQAGLPAVTEVLADGISVNVTLIFSIDRYRDVMRAHSEGLRLAQAAGRDLASIESVASFFVSRVDTAVDAALSGIDTDRASKLRGTAAIANARLAWAAYLAHTTSEDWQQISAAGGRPQRPLWASTGVKDPAFDPARYVVELIAPGSVNTLPEGTLHAVAESQSFRGDTVTGTAEESAATVAELADLGIDLDTVCATLEQAGVASFIESWEALRSNVARSLDSDA